MSIVNSEVPMVVAQVMHRHNIVRRDDCRYGIHGNSHQFYTAGIVGIDPNDYTFARYEDAKPGQVCFIGPSRAHHGDLRDHKGRIVMPPRDDDYYYDEATEYYRRTTVNVDPLTGRASWPQSELPANLASRGYTTLARGKLGLLWTSLTYFTQMCELHAKQAATFAEWEARNPVPIIVQPADYFELWCDTSRIHKPTQRVRNEQIDQAWSALRVAIESDGHDHEKEVDRVMVWLERCR